MNMASRGGMIPTGKTEELGAKPVSVPHLRGERLMNNFLSNSTAYVQPTSSCIISYS
jgi:hypothetical protein